MFDPTDRPRVFALPPGVQYIAALVQGLECRLKGSPPEAWARVRVVVNSHKTRQLLLDRLCAGPARFIPQIAILDDLANTMLAGADIPPAVSPLRRRLELTRLVSSLLDRQPGIAPRAATFDLADSLADLMDEMHGEGVNPEALEQLDISNHSEHWALSLRFLNILKPYFEDASEPDIHTRRSMVVSALLDEWRKNPPQDPVLVVGSTGSLGAMRRLMEGVVGLPQGAVILPGLDFDLPQATAAYLQQEDCEDHPQAVVARTLLRLGVSLHEVSPWSDSVPPSPARNRLISLALRPAPVTDQWLSEGPRLADLAQATAGLTLIEAASPRQEALAIALRLRKAAEDRQRAILISPDRNLTRQVAAALDRWDILPDDSAGRPLPLTPPGVFLRLLANLMGHRIDGEALLALLKHPLTHSGTSGRNEHLLQSRELELWFRREGPPFADFAAIRGWAANRDAKKGNTDTTRWVDWLEAALAPLEKTGPQDLSAHLGTLRKAAETLAGGPDGGAGELWEKSAGEKAAEIFTDLETCADAAGEMGPSDFTALLRSVLDREEVREAVTPHPLIAIWGPREARLINADLVILAGLNEGVWPSTPAPDPWLSRTMRKQCGLLSPERQIGLSAQDFQIGICFDKVVLSRARRDAEAPTVASRWLIRLTNLLGGLGETGKNSLHAMRKRGQEWLDLAQALETPAAPLPPARRPAPRPPVSSRPRQLSVTRIKTLVRDPYSIYASRILRLKPLEKIRPEPDAMMRGNALHLVMQRFVEETMQGLPDNAAEQLVEIAHKVLEQEVPWPSTRRLWAARLSAIAPDIVTWESNNRTQASPLALECKGRLHLSDPDFDLTGTADRIDRRKDGKLVIYDYKTGAIPTQKQVMLFDKQLPLEAAMAAEGGFTGVPANVVAQTTYVGIGTRLEIRDIPIDNDVIHETLDGLRNLLRAYQKPETGYIARARMEKRTDPSDYDHLSRKGEWDESDPAQPEDVS